MLVVASRPPQGHNGRRLMRAKMLFSAVVAVSCSVLVIASVAWAAGATTKVTLNGPDSVFGTIHSPRTSCLGGRTVIVYMQKGGAQNPKVDQKMDSTTSSRQGKKGVWDMGNPGFPKHKIYYAMAKKKTGCKAGFSKSVKF
jgi:hypothetical protein